MGMYNLEDNMRQLTGQESWEPTWGSPPAERRATGRNWRMNGIQLPATVVPVIAWLAGVLAGKGVFGLDSGVWITLLSGAAGLGLAVYGAFSARKSAVVTTAANLPEVKSISLDPTSPGAQDLNHATPANVRVGA